MAGCRQRSPKGPILQHQTRPYVTPILDFSKRGRPYMIYMDASGYQLGAVLLQQQEDTSRNQWGTIMYWSRSMTKEKRDYYAT